MVKYTRRQYKKNKNNKRKYTKKMYGGDDPFTRDDKLYLTQNNFTNDDIEYLEYRKRNGANIPISFIRTFINRGYSADRIISDMKWEEETDTESQTSEGGKRRKRNGKSRKSRRKQRGGMCFGNGVGANSYDPNFSIYNTRELQLFPYKPIQT
jgi:hypothetical protein